MALSKLSPAAGNEDSFRLCPRNKQQLPNCKCDEGLPKDLMIATKAVSSSIYPALSAIYTFYTPPEQSNHSTGLMKYAKSDGTGTYLEKAVINSEAKSHEEHCSCRSV